MPEFRLFGEYELTVLQLQNGRTYYRLTRGVFVYPKTLLEFDVDGDGRRTDYLNLDKFWGHVARPIGVDCGDSCSAIGK